VADRRCLFELLFDFFGGGYLQSVAGSRNDNVGVSLVRWQDKRGPIVGPFAGAGIDLSVTGAYFFRL
jgi:hypothetical protein